MKASFLSYYKEILQKVSFDDQLLKKEYLKALSHLSPSEQQLFKTWIAESSLKNRLHKT